MSNLPMLRVQGRPERTKVDRSNDCYSSGERKWMEAGQRLRHWALLPTLKVLAKFGVSPDMVTLVAGVIGLIFLPAWLVGWHVVALVCLLVHVLLDGLDGPLARFQGVASPRGSFTDTCADQIVLSAVVLAWVIAMPSAANIAAGTIFIFTYTCVVAFAMIRNAMAIPYIWLLRPRFLVYGCLLIDLLFEANSVLIAICASDTILTVALCTGIYNLRRALPGPNKR